ncbi:MAG: CDP-diacylglycerol--glycerol-3-phosphate 3-phosphatidyltransferase [Polyangiaceae bacterium]
MSSPDPSLIDQKTQRAARRRSLKEDAVNLPNMLTFGRIVIIPFVLILLDRGGPVDCFWAAWVYAAAAITDFFDGYIARKRGLVSVLGKFLDPLADKLIVMATLVWLAQMGRIPTWVVVLLLGREFSITGLRSIASNEGMVIAAGEGGKSKTALQMIGILCLIVGYPYAITFGFADLGIVDFAHVGRGLIYLSLFFSITSAAEYVGLFATAVEAKDRALQSRS